MASEAEVGSPEVLESPMDGEGGIRDHNGPIGNHGHVEDEDEDVGGEDVGDEGDDLVDCRPGMRK